jgi:hypothetical protein
MNRWTKSLLHSCIALSFTAIGFAQDASGEYAKAMAAYQAYDYQKSCRQFTNLYGATNKFGQLPADVVESMQKTPRDESSYTMAALQAENAHDAAKACSEHFLKALLLSIHEDWLRASKSAQSAMVQREKMIEETEGRRESDPSDVEGESKGTSSLADIVKASKAATSGEGTCATDEMLLRDKSLVAPCVQHLMTQARKQKRARQYTMARLNFQRAVQVNKMLGAKQDPAVNREAVNSIHAIEAAQRLR